MNDGVEHAHLWPGVPLALGSAVLFGATPPLSKLLLGEISPFLLAGLLYLGAGLGLGLLQAARWLAGLSRPRIRRLPEATCLGSRQQSYRVGSSLHVGGLMVVGACLAWGIDNNLTRRISAADPVRITIWKGLVVGSVNVGLALETGSTLPSPMQIALTGLLGFFAVGVSLVFFIRALRHLGSARTGAYFRWPLSSAPCWRSACSVRR